MTQTSGKRLIGAVLFLMLMLAAAETGCTAGSANITELNDSFTGKHIAVLDVTPPRRGRLVWTTLLAGQLDMTKSEEIAFQVENEIVGLGKYTIADRSQVRSVLDEHDLQRGITDKSAQKIGKLVGVDGLVTVRSVQRLGWIGPFLIADTRANIRLIDVSTGEVVWTAVGRFRDMGVILIPMWSDFSTTPPEYLVAKRIRAELEKKLTKK